ncbi:MAG: hypothetical protein FOGNACKC_03152 [Anaerolineae bacterium]|nr:hypothetical protein [Anaerolineae bacterium]
METLQMPSTDRRAQLMVEDSANILKRFYFVQRALVVMQAGWVPGAEHWQSKLLLPEFLWQDALVAKELRQRVLELRYPERKILPGDDAPFLAVWQKLADAPHSLAFSEGLRQVVKPLLRRVYQTYLDTADHLDDGPTIRIIRQALWDIDDQLGRWDAAADDARAVYPEQITAAGRWVSGLNSLREPLFDWLTRWPVSPPAPAFEPADFGGQPFAISRTGARDRRFDTVKFPWPDALYQRHPGEGMELQIRQATHHLNEIWATEMAAACIFDLADHGPAEFLDDAARWCYDEVRHCRMGFERFAQWGFTLPEMPIGTFSYDAGAEADPLTRLGIIFYFETTFIHTKWERFRIFGEAGDRVSSHDMDFDWADEQIHTHYGSRWLKYFLQRQKDSRTPIDFRPEAEACVARIRAAATPQDYADTERIYQRTMARARQLAVAVAPVV